MKVLTIFTGGTIGCVPAVQGKPRNLPGACGLSCGGTAPGKTARDYYLLSEYSAKHRGVDFDTMEPISVLSENMTTAKWDTLLGALRGVDFASYDGVVITHGSDTLAFTAALLAVALWDVSVPVALVSSNHDLHDPRANGHSNLAAAIDFFACCRLPGVYVFYGYESGRTVVYEGSRIKQSRAFINRYEDISGDDFGFMESGRFCPGGAYFDKSPFPNSEKYTRLLDKFDKLSARVLVIEPYPGLDYSVFNIRGGNTDAVLHGTYHSFSFCVGDEPGADTSVLGFIRRCADSGITLYFAPFGAGLTADQIYASTHAALGSDARFIEGVTTEYAYAKLMLGITIFGRSGADLDEFLRCDPGGIRIGR